MNLMEKQFESRGRKESRMSFSNRRIIAFAEPHGSIFLYFFIYIWRPCILINLLFTLRSDYLRAPIEYWATAYKIGKLDPRNEKEKEMFARIPQEVYKPGHNIYFVSAETYQYYLDNKADLDRRIVNVSPPPPLFNNSKRWHLWYITIIKFFIYLFSMILSIVSVIFGGPFFIILLGLMAICFIIYIFSLNENSRPSSLFAATVMPILYIPARLAGYKM